MTQPESKHCTVCGRRFEWRTKWADDWEQVKYCSARCRRNGLDPVDQLLEEAIVRLLRGRSGDATLCPSEAARAVSPDDWRPLMEPARAAGRRLANRDLVVFRQGGTRVDPSTASGAVRLGRGNGWDRPLVESVLA